ncbi:E3 ubiquitin/ISG15 ligase TRIM25-like isoform X2 [Myxocyprinus asiaticus]|uniref:E3 ubiquitin/ISG15 ligase TRIM25-like isoform X2 n=1 Tax=Myxocyprinus asiaticus TaxID=70543 RepID=UPI00222173A4|nr:E3 ubiquitin/ISG15 ligase TRIM25-like isoform X2 [Myxocyprinus asiaticus]
MAEASISVAEEQFSCPICLDLLKDPVTIPCGHSYCMSCITDYWNQDDHLRVCSCPQCRHTFTPRPVLAKNVVFAEMVEKLKKTRIQAAVPAHCYAGQGDVECDVCTGRKCKAVKSCLMCLESYCQHHFERHEEFHSGKRHKVTDATGRLQQMICPKHDKQLDIYCITDQQCICYLCTMDEHKTHDTVTAAAERTDKQKQLKEAQSKFKLRIQERKKDVQELREALKSHKRSAKTAVEDSERIFTELIHSIERSRSEVTQLIRAREKAAVSRAEGLLEQLEQEISDLRRRDAEIQQLLHTEDHIHFLKSLPSLSVPPESVNRDSITVSSLLSFDDVRQSVSLLRGKFEDFFKGEIEKISGRSARPLCYPEQTIITPSPFIVCRAPKRDKKHIRIRDPNQGGKDITEEIMSKTRSCLDLPASVIVKADNKPKLESSTQSSASPEPWQLETERERRGQPSSPVLCPTQNTELQCLEETEESQTHLGWHEGE